MTQTLIEKLEALPRYDYESRGYMGFGIWQALPDGKKEYIRTEDMLSAIQDENNKLGLSGINEQKLMGSEIYQAAANYYEPMVAELVKALEDFQKVVQILINLHDGVETLDVKYIEVIDELRALLAKAKEMMG